MAPLFIALLSEVSGAQQKFDQEQYLRELNECINNPNASVAEASECQQALFEKYKKMAEGQKGERGEQADKKNLIYRCNIPALGGSALGSRIEVWASKSSKGRYYVTSQGGGGTTYSANGFGTPRSGDFSLNFDNGTHITIAENGWTTTSKDKVYNKNSLYGEVSEKNNKPSGECR
ncbi:hypothetical protein [Pseudomonas jessenii]|uniref:hypothetical protein n=1 Tax=Pseudomonas jessenii TaxID=77298 RepID=UPI00389149EE